MKNLLQLAIPLARYLIAALAQPPWSIIVPTLDGVAPVPLHVQRLAERGYNQSEQLATAFCRQTRLPLHTDWFQRQRDNAVAGDIKPHRAPSECRRRLHSQPNRTQQDNFIN